MQEMISYLKSKEYIIRWVIGDTACYSYKNAKGHYVNANTMSVFDYELAKIF